MKTACCFHISLRMHCKQNKCGQNKKYNVTSLLDMVLRRKVHVQHVHDAFGDDDDDDAYDVFCADPQLPCV